MTGGSDGLLLTSSLGSLVLKSGGAGGDASGISLLLGGSKGLGGGVKDLHHSLVSEGVLLASVSLVLNNSDHAELRLDLIGVNDSGEVGAGHHVSSELESGLLDTGGSVGTEDVVELAEGILGEDDESSEVTTRGELEKV